MVIDVEEYLNNTRKYFRLAENEDIYITRNKVIVARLQNLKRDRLERLMRHQVTFPKDFDYEAAKRARLDKYVKDIVGANETGDKH